VEEVDLQEEDLLDCWKQFVLHPEVAEHQVEVDYLVVVDYLVMVLNLVEEGVHHLVVAEEVHLQAQLLRGLVLQAHR
jgi:hypothetical protein